MKRHSHRWRKKKEGEERGIRRKRRREEEGEDEGEEEGEEEGERERKRERKKERKRERKREREKEFLRIKSCQRISLFFSLSSPSSLFKLTLSFRHSPRLGIKSADP